MADHAVLTKPATAGRGRIYDSILDTVGDTPLVRLPRLDAAKAARAEVLAKLAFFNPLASVKDRIARAMNEGLERDGRIRPGDTLIEPTSGNTGIGLAFVAAAKGYRLLITMPESVSIERRKMLKLLGAELFLTPAEKGMKGAVARAEELLADTPGAVMPQQFANPDNPAVHRRTTAEEIWRDTGGRLDLFVAGIGTGGTITGVAQALKPRLPGLKVFGVEPADSPFLSEGRAGPHKIQGIGAGFRPDVLETGLIDGYETVSNDEAFAMAREAARLEGLPGGVSTGAALTAAYRLAGRPEHAGKRLVVIVPSFAERYLSTPLFEGLDG